MWKHEQRKVLTFVQSWAVSGCSDFAGAFSTCPSPSCSSPSTSPAPEALRVRLHRRVRARAAGFPSRFRRLPVSHIYSDTRRRMRKWQQQQRAGGSGVSSDRHTRIQQVHREKPAHTFTGLFGAIRATGSTLDGRTTESAGALVCAARDEPVKYPEALWCWFMFL